ILSLLETRDFEENPAWIAERLGINPVEASAALERLERLGLVARAQSGKLLSTEKNVATTNDVASAALRRSHRQSLEQAIEKLEEIDVEDRDITSITMAIDPAALPLAKKMIREFRRKLCATLETGKRSEVYNLNVQLVPVSRLREKRRRK
ncbi:MAG TPA: DUF4423 domain-containing protein, partial [Bdellovibrionota bacterium]|nr:DUF4423 domain-containing protein [Bdellovibrionota bacterium]